MVYLCYTIVGYLSCRTWRSCLCLNAASGAPRRPMPPPALARSEFCCLQNFRFLEKHANERLIVTSVNVTMRAEFLIRLHSSCFYCCFCQWPSQFAPIILVLKIWVGLWPWKKPGPKYGPEKSRLQKTGSLFFFWITMTQFFVPWFFQVHNLDLIF